MLEGYTTLAHAAAVTERIELGTLVTGVTYRHPGLLLKTVTTLDVLSGGRAWLGIGAAWNEEEHRGLGVPYPSTRERFRAARGHPAPGPPDVRRRRQPVRGGVDQPRAAAEPPAAGAPPPIMVGGGGEQRTLRLVAQYADACNLFDLGLGPQGIPHKLDVIRRHCEDVGRDDDEISKTCLARLTIDTGADLPDGVHRALGRPGRRAARRCSVMPASTTSSSRWRTRRTRRPTRWSPRSSARSPDRRRTARPICTQPPQVVHLPAPRRP